MCCLCLFSRKLSAPKALQLATTYLDQARNTQDQNHAVKSCAKARESLDKVKTEAISISDLLQIISKYREHGAILERLGLPSEAQESYRKADELR